MAETFYRVGTITGDYSPIDIDGLPFISLDRVVPDPGGLLGKVIGHVNSTSEITLSEHVALFDAFIKAGLKTLDLNRAVGPVLNEQGEAIHGHMRVITYVSKL